MKANISTDDLEVRWLPPKSRSGRRWLICFSAVAIILVWNLVLLHNQRRSLLKTEQESFRECSIEAYLATGLPFLDSAERLSLEEFALRRNNLAKALVMDGVDAFVAEPGYTFSYYANITQTQWEPWEPEERPFLLIIRPGLSADGEVVAKTSFLVPHFEENRARLLHMPFADEISTIVYEEQDDYYAVLYTAEFWSSILSPIIMVDEEIRDFIQRGLASTGFTVRGLGGEVEAVRQVKSEREIGILRAVNTGTVEAIRAMRPCLYPGVTENQVRDVLDDTLRAAGFDPFFDIVEFGKSAALPHGGYDGTRKLEAGMLILIDVGAHLYGYSSDVTRTFYPGFHNHSQQNSESQVKVWHLVRKAQAAAVKSMVTNNTAAAVDIAARGVIEEGGYGKYFTHRLGHSIGIKAHESPYLNRGNFEAILRPNMVFTAEPGIYILDEFGVRLEDVLLVKKDGEAESLSGHFAQSPWEP